MAEDSAEEGSDFGCDIGVRVEVRRGSPSSISSCSAKTYFPPDPSSLSSGSYPCSSNNRSSLFPRKTPQSNPTSTNLYGLDVSISVDFSRSRSTSAVNLPYYYRTQIKPLPPPPHPLPRKLSPDQRRNKGTQAVDRMQERHFLRGGGKTGGKGVGIGVLETHP